MLGLVCVEGYSKNARNECHICPYIYIYIYIYIKVKVIPQQAEVAQVFPGRIRPPIFLTFGTTRVVGRQP